MLDHLLTAAPRRASLRNSPNRLVVNVMRSMARVSRWIELHRQRDDLEELDDHQLADIGLSRAQVRKECSKWPWQP
jgi:uncharacterized protein YjiS (DUF1127 family)